MTCSNIDSRSFDAFTKGTESFYIRIIHFVQYQFHKSQVYAFTEFSAAG